MKQYFFYLLFFLFCIACKTTKPVLQTTNSQIISQDIFVQLQINQIKAIDLEESISMADELMLNYSMASFDESGKAIEVVNGAWGVEKAKKGQVFSEKFKPIQLKMPPKGKIIASVILTEIDDYEKAKAVITSINKLGGLAQGVAALIELGSYETPLAFVAGTLQAAGLGIKLVDHFDNDDILGSDIRQISANDFSRTVTIPLVFKGKVLLDKYHYQMSYSLVNNK